jgi:riboflavin transporter FmnP
MNTKTLTLIIAFTALSAALSIYFPKIPAPYAPFLYYQIWEIPIVAAFIAIGPKTGTAIAALNTLILLAVFPGNLPTGPFYNLIAVLSMLLGVFAAYKIAVHGCPTENMRHFLTQHVKVLTVSITALGVITRVAITTTANYFLIAQPTPIGFGSFFEFGGLAGQQAVIAFLPFSILFNATIALYTIPIGLVIALTINKSFKLQK